MLISTLPLDINVARTALASITPTVDQLQTIKSELTSDPEKMGYADLISTQNWLGVALKLSFPYEADNPTPQSTVNREIITNQDIALIIADATAVDGQTPLFLSLDTDADGSDVNKAAIAKQILWLTSTQIPSFDLTLPKWQVALGGALQLGMIDQTTFNRITTTPDPTWQSRLKFVSRLEQLGFVTNTLLSQSDIQSALDLP